MRRPIGARWGAIAIVVVLGASPAAWADGEPTPWPGVRGGGSHGDHWRPARFGEGRWLVGGYIQPRFATIADTDYDDAADDGFSFGNARLLGRGEHAVSRDVRAVLRYNFDVAAGAFEVSHLYGSIEFGENTVVLDAGRLRVPFTRSALTSEARYQLVDGTRLLSLGYDRDLGAQLRGRGDIEAVNFGWWLGMYNGEGAQRNFDQKYLFVARLEMGPLGRVPIGEPDLDDSDLRFALGASAAFTPSIGRGAAGAPDLGARELRASIDLALKYAGLSFLAEYVFGKVDEVDAGSGFQRRGVTVQSGYVLPFDFRPLLEVAGRFTQVEADDGSDGFTGAGKTALDYGAPDRAELRVFEAGINAYFIDHRLKSSVGWRRTRHTEGLEKQSGQDPLVGDALVVQLQLGWL